MATIQTRKSDDGKTVSYRVMIRLKGHPTQTATFARKTDADRWAKQTEAAIREGRHFATSEAKRHTLGDLIDRYLREVMPSKALKSQAAQTTQLDWWKAQLGGYTLDRITPPLLAQYRDRLATETLPPRTQDPSKAGPPRRRSASTVVRYLAALSHVFTVSVREWQWTEVNPLVRVTKPKEPRGRVRFLSEDAPDGAPGERTRLLAACKASASADLYPAVVLALSTGARAQEVLGLRWPQVDLVRRAALLEDTKNGERRVLPLHGLALDLLKDRAKVRKLDTDLLFPGRPRRDETGKLIYKPVDLRTPFETALRVAGVEDFHWHDLRHSAASYLAMGGASLAEIAEVLGHKTLAMVGRYAHLSEAHTSAVVSRMNRKIFGE